MENLARTHSYMAFSHFTSRCVIGTCERHLELVNTCCNWPVSPWLDGRAFGLARSLMARLWHLLRTRGRTKGHIYFWPADVENGAVVIIHSLIFCSSVVLFLLLFLLHLLLCCCSLTSTITTVCQRCSTGVLCVCDWRCDADLCVVNVSVDEDVFVFVCVSFPHLSPETN